MDTTCFKKQIFVNFLQSIVDECVTQNPSMDDGVKGTLHTVAMCTMFLPLRK